MFESFTPSGIDGCGLLYNIGLEDAPEIVQRVPIADPFFSLVNIIPTDGNMPRQAIVMPLFDAIESL